ncbi:hypothetical protein F5883DRAFT_200042 [Diaporthe sp. PMI_573]|nr:hypothetical protein F5883DRAFT_200042 [Diaporthaceae sp. PMI_573]
MPGSQTARLLDGAGAFASEIAFESKTVTGFYNEFKESLGKIDKEYFEHSIRVETDTLVRLDDILDELAMIRRVQEDIRLVFLDVYDFDAAVADRLVARGRSKLNRLEADALRVRESLVTLLGLQQREVNTEGLLNSEFQTQIVFIFTAATVFFAPLSWVTSLLALTIQDFTPADSTWSRRGVATASSITVASFALLIILGWWVWKHHSKLFSLFKPRASRKSDNEGETTPVLAQNTVATRASGRDWVRGLLPPRVRDRTSNSLA